MGQASSWLGHSSLPGSRAVWSPRKKCGERDEHGTCKFTDDIPLAYDRGLGQVLFHDYADHTARHVARLRPQQVLETCAGTGIVTRRLRDVLPATTAMIATDLNASM